MNAGRTLPEESSRSVALRDRYEELRREADGRIPGAEGGGHGLALFLSRGMVAWMKAVLPLAPTVPLRDIRPAPAGIPGPVREELTGLLVSMLLARKGG